MRSNGLISRINPLKWSEGLFEEAILIQDEGGVQ